MTDAASVIHYVGELGEQGLLAKVKGFSVLAQTRSHSHRSVAQVYEVVPQSHQRMGFVIFMISALPTDATKEVTDTIGQESWLCTLHVALLYTFHIRQFRNPPTCFYCTA